MKKIRSILLCSVFMICSMESLYAQKQDKLLQLLKQELKSDMQELQKQSFPPYHMNFRVMDVRETDISSTFGNILRSSTQHIRSMVPQIRLGSPELDNFKYRAMGAPTDRKGNIPMAYISLEDVDGEDATRQAIWYEVSKRYEYALNSLQKAKTQSQINVADEDKAPSFSDAPVEKYYEEPLPVNKINIDKAYWEKRLNEVSAVFKKEPLLLTGNANLSFHVLRTYFVNTEGTEVVQNRTYARIVLSASMKAKDGMELPLNISYFAYEPQNLPDNNQMIKDAQQMIGRLKLLREAPIVDPYTGPALLSGAASGVFFHEIFGHRIEGHRLKSGGQTFKKMVGEYVLPKDFQVYSDPTMREYAGIEMNGYYLYDDQGVKARRVDVVKDGILKEFLMSRVPLDGFPHSNGHARTSGGGDPVSRQANLVVETKSPKTEAEMRNMLIEEAKKQNKEYGYYFKEVTSGFTYTGEGGSLNSFNVTPLEVYRIYVDGRPDELVRGVDLIGTPLSMFSNIVCGGSTASVFTGECGAESGWVPVTASSPMILVNKIETQRRQKSLDLPPLLKAPEQKL